MKAKINLNLDVVREFFLDVWEDLKETGVAGVAVGMAITFVAVTALVLKPGGPPEINTGYAAANAAPPTEVALALPEDKPLNISDIDLEAPRDPFQTLDSLKGGGSSDGGGPTTVSVEDTTTAPTGSGSGGGGTPAGDSVDTSDELVPLDDLEPTRTTAPVDDGPAKESEPSGEVSPGEKKPSPPPTDYSYAADVQFGPEGSLTRYKSVERLEFVPSRANPLLMYLGVKADHETAVFMVDSRLSQGGEGKCVPKPSNCTFIELSTNPGRDEHRFRDADGEEYLLRMRGVVKTSAKAGSVGGPDAPKLPGTPGLIDGSR